MMVDFEDGTRVSETHIAAAPLYEWAAADVICIMRPSAFISVAIAAFCYASARPQGREIRTTPLRPPSLTPHH
jgi:hypothetical protein